MARIPTYNIDTPAQRTSSESRGSPYGRQEAKGPENVFTAKLSLSKYYRLAVGSKKDGELQNEACNVPIGVIAPMVCVYGLDWQKYANTRRRKTIWAPVCASLLLEAAPRRRRNTIQRHRPQ